MSAIAAGRGRAGPRCCCAPPCMSRSKGPPTARPARWWRCPGRLARLRGSDACHWLAPAAPRSAARAQGCAGSRPSDIGSPAVWSTLLFSVCSSIISASSAIALGARTQAHAARIKTGTSQRYCTALHARAAVPMAALAFDAAGDRRAGRAGEVAQRASRALLPRDRRSELAARYIGRRAARCAHARGPETTKNWRGMLPADGIRALWCCRSCARCRIQPAAAHSVTRRAATLPIHVLGPHASPPPRRQPAAPLSAAGAVLQHLNPKAARYLP